MKADVIGNTGKFTGSEYLGDLNIDEWIKFKYSDFVLKLGSVVAFCEHSDYPPWPQRKCGVKNNHCCWI